MKHFTVLLIMACAASVGFTHILFSDDHPICDQKPAQLAEMVCEGDSKFYVDQLGRCGCLERRAVIPPHVCEKVRSQCGMSMSRSNLFHYEQISFGSTLRLWKKTFVGCGCYESTPSS